jgi:hypothetical protein
MIHLWNERMPPLPASGADLVYARRLYHLQLHSFSLVARHIQIAAEYQPAQLLGGITVLAPVDMPDGGTAMLKHFGFSVMPYHSPLGGFGEFWENLLTWGLMWTYNPPSLRSRSLWGLQRSEFWVSRARFLKKFGLATPSP